MGMETCHEPQRVWLTWGLPSISQRPYNTVNPPFLSDSIVSLRVVADYSNETSRTDAAGYSREDLTVLALPVAGDTPHSCEHPA